MVDGRKLTEIINSDHENVKYMPGIKLPESVVAIPDVVEAAADADIIIVVVPHQFIPRTLAPLKGKLKKSAFAISLNKGFGEKDGQFVLISQSIRESLGIDCAVLMGANLAKEVAKGDFCETTIGCREKKQGKILKQLFHTDNFMVTVVEDAYTVEICGALKNIVACAAGICQGLGQGDNTKAAVIRLGLKEMIRFCRLFYAEGFQQSTFFESCGVADLVTTCYGGRNLKVSLEFTKRLQEGKDVTIKECEAELLNGQKLQGPETAAEVHVMLKEEKKLDQFPLFVAVHEICTKKIPPTELIPRLRLQPDDE